MDIFWERHAMTAFSPNAICAELFFLAVQYPAFQAHKVTMFIVCQMDCEMCTVHNGNMEVVCYSKNNLSIILCTLLMGFPFIQIRKYNFSF